MFDLRRPCANCPFRRAQGPLFGFSAARLGAIIDAPAFQCHKTVDYAGERPASGERPQQCAGLMAMLHAEGRPNQIMQVAERLTGFDAGRIDAAGVYRSSAEAIAGHAGGRGGES